MLLGRASRLVRPLSTSSVVAVKKKVAIAKASKAVKAIATKPSLSAQKLLYKCPRCAFSHQEKSGIKAHLREVHEALPYSCTHCSEGFTNFKKLRDHIKGIHHGVAIPDEPYLIILRGNESTTESHDSEEDMSSSFTLAQGKSEILRNDEVDSDPLKDNKLPDFEALSLPEPGPKYFNALYPLKASDMSHFEQFAFEPLKDIKLADCDPLLLLFKPCPKYCTTLYPLKACQNLSSFSYHVANEGEKRVETIPIEQRSAFVQSSLANGTTRVGAEVDELIKASQEALKKASQDAMKKATEAFKNLISSIK